MSSSKKLSDEHTKNNSFSKKKTSRHVSNSLIS